MIRFTEKDHIYRSLDPEKPIKWTSITSLISQFKPKFDAQASAEKVSKNKKSKWYKMDPADIRAVWSKESMRSLDMGTWYHNKTEKTLLSSPTFAHDGVTYNIVKPTVIGGEKYAPIQALEENTIYPEHMVYLASEGICGQTDRVRVYDGKVNVNDYKTSKAIKAQGFVNWEGIAQKMAHPIDHLEDCNMVHYTLQMSLYMYIILKHNPWLAVGDLVIDHILFEQEAEDEYGYPIYKKDDNGDFVITDIVQYKVPYMKKEVMSILTYLKNERLVL